MNVNRVDGAIVFSPHPNIGLRLADAITLIKAGIAVAFGRAAIINLK